MGHVPADWEESGRILPSAGTETEGEDYIVEPGLYIDLPYTGGSDIKSGSEGGGNLHHPPSEHRCEMYHNKAHFGPVSDGGAARRSSGFKVVVLIGGN